jgi:hypothetical protein
MKNDVYDISKELSTAISTLNAIRSHFNNVSDPEMIEESIYHMKALETRISYLTKVARTECDNVRPA